MKNGLIIEDDGTTGWYKDDKLHREDGPAVVYSNGDKVWALNGEPHRVNGPAAVYFCGNKLWYLNGRLHRIDGPAIENIDGNNFWYLYGKKISERKFKKHPIVIAHREKQFLEQTVSETKSSKKDKL